MKQIYTLLIVVLVLLLSASCKDDSLLPTDNSNTPDGMVRIALVPTLAGETMVQTRTNASPNETALTGTNYALAFDSDDLTIASLTQTPTQVVLDGSVLKGLFHEETDTRYLCIVTALSLTQVTYLQSLNEGSRYTEIQKNLFRQLPTAQPIEIDPTSPLPLSGWSAGITLQRSVTPSINVSLSRVVARIDIDATPSNFIVSGAQVANSAKWGYQLPTADGSLPAWDITQVIDCQMQTQPEGQLLVEKLYTYEHAAGDAGSAKHHPLRIVIKGRPASSTTDSYYGIDIEYTHVGDPTKKLYDIRRNYIYTIRLNKVEKDGYNTAELAARSAAFNTQVDVEITVTDPYAHDIVTNGRQYLGVTNTDFVIYPYDALEVKNVLATSFTYTTDPAWSSGSITLSGGLTTATGVSTVLPLSDTPVQRDLLINIPADFTNGTIVLHVGNLRKEIRVRRMVPMSSSGGVFNNYFMAPAVATDFKIGEIIAPTVRTEWLKVATTDDGSKEAALSNRVISTVGGVWFHVSPYFLYGDAATAVAREAALYMTGGPQGERIRVHVQQKPEDIYIAANKVQKLKYVGAFWRANQTGERIIRMYGNSDDELFFANGSINPNYGKEKTPAVYSWEANVVAGREWIVMDTQESPDSGVKVLNGGTPNPYAIGATTTNFGDAVEAYQVNSKLRTVSGMGNYIYFRIGLTGTLGGAQTAPRYGLIIISYRATPTSPTQYHPIYVRQGEAADYLMRPFDPITTNPISTNNPTAPMRRYAVKLSPYNLDDPLKDNSGYTVSRGTRGYTFADYPTQGGLYFQPLTADKAFPANNSYDPVDEVKYSNASWINEAEGCPRGYRRINDGNNTMENPWGYLVDSELRQSIMLFPTEGGDGNLDTNPSDLTNQYIGFMADGYFDRQPIVDAVDLVMGTEAGRTPLSCVKPNQIGEAFSGTLFFNPVNYASIFIPNAGTQGRGSGTAGFIYKGLLGSMWTSTRANTQRTWCFWVGFVKISGDWKTLTTSYYNSNPFGFPVRCVKDEQPLINTGGETAAPGSGTTVTPVNPPDNALIAARHWYEGNLSLQAQIETEYPDLEVRQRINSIVISGEKPLTADDYLYLNAWASADNSAASIGNFTGHALHHLIIHGRTPFTTIPSGAFTSNGWVSIELRSDLHIIADGAFTAGLSKLSTLSVLHLDDVTAVNGTGIGTGSFQFNTSQTSLRLTGSEWSTISGNATVWKGYSWKSIKKED